MKTISFIILVCAWCICAPETHAQKSIDDDCDRTLIEIFTSLEAGFAQNQNGQQDLSFSFRVVPIDTAKYKPVKSTCTWLQAGEVNAVITPLASNLSRCTTCGESKARRAAHFSQHGIR